ncbi:hypothetical protein ACFO1B_39010 [Dactylosporangium siamense]|uniref:Uncharacterized protein n=1 Tax=Dactylosporangium siamense TaxID=685454 RepID=A0A919PXT8_9ACTN|nr:hypothetical protein [Dactylosporangium siamense]GIG50330.1 hypothetical protein Dsi01nite_083710 [Dactylosporangium siamense]
MSAQHPPDGGEDETVIESYVAGCPIGPELAGQLIELADLPWDDPDVTDRAMRHLGWSDEDIPIDDARFVTTTGHVVHGDRCLYLPFAHSYRVGGELWPDDFWGSLPGWTSQRGAGREEFAAHVDVAIDRLAERLGAPQCDARTEGTRISIGRYSWRYAAWRRGGNIIVVGPALDGFSYCQDEEAVVYLGGFPENAPFPDAADFLDLISG